ncbi:putative ABC transporter ATP-binding protein YxlF [mine drainage metagenome]|uniref:Putative ABC transporter ATP-binding protein YxlF n=1 Tax=mine drainage metagenome TaxID=410659 RepID=A0A1J5T9D8_9ZZZZ
MTIQLTDAGKRFNRDWIFRHVNFTFHKGKSYAITGPNGSGKSTLLQSIAGSMNLSEGVCEWSTAHRPSSTVPSDDVYQYISIAAPYLEVIEEMSAKEFLLFHTSFKPLLSSVTIDEIIKIIGLEKTADKQIRYFSSGMKQRIKLAQAIFSDASILLLDEPCTNLDATGYALYHQLIKNYCNDKLIIVSSNDENEMDFCEEKISIMDYK